MTTNTHTTANRRLVNARIAYLVENRHGQHLEFSMGAEGNPERALARAAKLAEGRAQYVDGVRIEVAGIAITDVRTGEQWLVTL